MQLRELVDPDIQHIEPIEANKDIITLLLNNNRALLTVRNKVKILNDGKAKSRSCSRLSKGAVSSVHLEYYIFENDETGAPSDRPVGPEGERGGGGTSDIR